MSMKQPQENKISTSFWRCKILTWLLEKHITVPPVGGTALERMTDTRKPSDTKTIGEEAGNKTTYFQYIVQYVKGSII